MVKFSDFSEDLHACNMCGYCVPVCPPYQEIGWESAAPRGKVYFMKNVEMRSPLDRILRRPTKMRDFAGRATQEALDFTRAVYECTGCGACEAVCHAEIPFDGFWDDVKEWLVNEGYGPLPEHRQMLKNVETTKNLPGKDNERRGDWFKEAGGVQSDQPEVLFWVGCAASFERQSIAKAVVKILNAGNVRYRVLGREEWCSGGPIARIGGGDYVKKTLMPHNMEAVEGTGAKALVTACAECYRAWTKDYRRYGGNPPFAVFHISQYIEKLVKEKRLKFTKKLDRKVTLHDACQLGRVCGQSEPPRNAMKYLQGVVQLEMFHNRDTTLCSGAHGGFREAFPQEAASLAARRQAEARDVGAQLMVTTCPRALAHMNEVKRGRALDVVDLAELAAEHL
ncbi:MAG: (Fe-S)-binding protein [Methanobacteriota archaeon]|nr:MAG: (Fe-S)-binding protein [Euryarchaeota archaeon]